MTIRPTGADAQSAPLSTLLQRLVLAVAFGAVVPLTTASAQAVDPGTTTTAWGPPTVSGPAVTPGTWRAGGPNPEQSGFRLVKESAHFAFYSDETLSAADLDLAAGTLENTVWQNLFNANLFMPEPFFNRADKIKPAIHIHSGWGLTGGAWVDNQRALHMGMWIAPAALKDRWGLTHEFCLLYTSPSPRD